MYIFQCGLRYKHPQALLVPKRSYFKLVNIKFHFMCIYTVTGWFRRISFLCERLVKHLPFCIPFVLLRNVNLHAWKHWPHFVIIHINDKQFISIPNILLTFLTSKKIVPLPVLFVFSPIFWINWRHLRNWINTIFWRK